MTYRRSIVTAVGVALVAFGVMSVAGQKPNRCGSGSMTLKECAAKYSNRPAFFDAADIKKWKRAVEVATYDVTDAMKGCDFLADLITKVKARAKTAFASANDENALQPHIFFWGNPMLQDTTINSNGDTVVSSVWGATDAMEVNGTRFEIIMIEDSLSSNNTFVTLIHEITHVADSTATEADIAKVEECVKREPKKEKPKPTIGGGGMGGETGPGPNIEFEHGYCEFEERTYCRTDDDGNDFCWRQWVLVYCTIL